MVGMYNYQPTVLECCRDHSYNQKAACTCIRSWSMSFLTCQHYSRCRDHGHRQRSVHMHCLCKWRTYDFGKGMF